MYNVISHIASTISLPTNERSLIRLSDPKIDIVLMLCSKINVLGNQHQYAICHSPLSPFLHQCSSVFCRLKLIAVDPTMYIRSLIP